MRNAPLLTNFPEKSSGMDNSPLGFPETNRKWTIANDFSGKIIRKRGFLISIAGI
jgi:hypothetical protein